jgi:hypothetical protein
MKSKKVKVKVKNGGLTMFEVVILVALKGVAK